MNSHTVRYLPREVKVSQSQAATSVQFRVRVPGLRVGEVSRKSTCLSHTLVFPREYCAVLCYCPGSHSAHRQTLDQGHGLFWLRELSRNQNSNADCVWGNKSNKHIKGGFIKNTINAANKDGVGLVGGAGCSSKQYRLEAISRVTVSC